MSGCKWTFNLKPEVSALILWQGHCNIDALLINLWSTKEEIMCRISPSLTRQRQKVSISLNVFFCVLHKSISFVIIITFLCEYLKDSRQLITFMWLKVDSVHFIISVALENQTYDFCVVLLHLELQCVYVIHLDVCYSEKLQWNYCSRLLISIVHYGDDVDGNYDIEFDSDDDSSSNENDFGSDDDVTKSSCVLWWLINQTNLKMDYFYRSVIARIVSESLLVMPVYLAIFYCRNHD